MSFGLVVVLAVLLLGDSAVRGDWVVFLRALGPLALLVWGIWVLMVRPVIRVDDTAIEVVNPLRVVRVPWGQVADVRMRYQIVVEPVHGRRVACWGGPTLPRPKPAARGTRPVMPQAAELVVVQDRWAERRDGSDPDAVVRRTWDRPALLLGVVAVLLVGVAVVV